MKRYLVLENGEVFAGLAFGAPCDTVGELVFTTGMNGYIETLTDPSYCGQIVLQTFPLIGNYGIIPADFEGKCCVRGYVVREQCQTPSNFRCEETLDAFLKANNIPGIAGIDTRAVTRILREAGTMNAAICDTVPDDLAPLRAYRITDPVPQVTTPEPYTLQPEGSVLHRVALIDYGAKRNIARELCRRGCAVTVLPCSAKAEDILAAGYDGVMLSNGPGDPTDNVDQIAEIAKLFGRIPMFGICLGHQLMALAGRQHREAQIRPSRREPAGARRVRHAHVPHQPEPRLRRRAREREDRRHPLHQRQRRHVRGRGLPRPAGLFRAVSPRGVLGPARHGLSLRPIL